MDLNILSTYRIQLTRVRDGHLFAGFVDSTGKGRISISLVEGDFVRPGEAFACTIIIHHQEARFDALATDIHGEVLELEITSELKLQKTERSGRRKVSYNHPVRVGHDSFDVQITDVAPEGVGLLLDRPIEVNKRVDIGFKVGPVTHWIPFHVCYCGENRFGDGFRVGCQLNESNSAATAIYNMAIQKDDPLFQLFQDSA